MRSATQTSVCFCTPRSAGTTTSRQRQRHLRRRPLGPGPSLYRYGGHTQNFPHIRGVLQKERYNGEN